MLLWKFSIAILVCIFLIKIGIGSVEGKACLMNEHAITIEHKGGPFGLLPHHLSMTKDGCGITIRHKQIFSNHWMIDVCREPIHIKKDSGANLQVYKRLAACDGNGSSSEFCQAKSQLLGLIENHGLIFAQGDRALLESDHGKVYCSYLLTKSYLSGHLFSTHSDQVNLLHAKSEQVSSPVDAGQSELETLEVGGPSPKEETQSSDEEVSGPTADSKTGEF